MKVHFEREIEALNMQSMVMATTVESAVRRALRAVTTLDPVLIKNIIDGDSDIDKDEVRIEEECLKILALYQPVAGDLRYVITILKVNNELERIGDLAVNIAERAAHLYEIHAPVCAVDFSIMFEKVESMLTNAIESLIHRHANIAAEVIRMDDDIDELNRQYHARLITLMKENPDAINGYLAQISISRNLERIADCVTNICEDVIYLEQGKIIRHSN